MTAGRAVVWLHGRVAPNTVFVVTTILCCCPLELSGRRPLTPRPTPGPLCPNGRRRLASSPSGRAHRFEPAWGSPTAPVPAARTRPKWRVCALDRTTPALPHGNRGPSDPFASSPSGRAHRFEPAWGSPAAPVPVPAARARPRVACVCSIRSLDPPSRPSDDPVWFPPRRTLAI